MREFAAKYKLADKSKQDEENKDDNMAVEDNGEEESMKIEDDKIA